jgi:hypothetical protein
LILIAHGSPLFAALASRCLRVDTGTDTPDQGKLQRR